MFVETHQPAIPTNVTIRASISGTQSGEFRVALLRPAAVTHAWDFYQRYIVLPVLPWVDLPGGEKEMVVTMPWNNRVAPPGCYMLTVVDSLGRPSNIEWIKIPKVP